MSRRPKHHQLNLFSNRSNTEITHKEYLQEIINNKDLYLEPETISMLKLTWLLSDAFYSNYIASSNSKESFNPNITKPINEALHDEWLHYGCRNATRFLIVDIDHCKMSLQTFKDYVFSKIGIMPSWIRPTTKGFHIGFILNSPVFAFDSKNVTILNNIKKILINLLDGDATATNKFYGFYRNPLTHKDTLINNRTFTLSQLSKLFKIRYQDQYSLFESKKETIIRYQKTITPKLNLNIKLPTIKQGKTTEVIEKGFKEGNRNNYLLAVGFKIVYEDRSKANNLFSLLNEINHSFDHVEPLNKNAVQNAVKFIIEKQLPTMFTPNNTVREYVRGKYSNYLWQHKIHGLKNRFRFGALITAKSKAESTAKDLLQAYTECISKGNINPTNKQLANKINKSIRTIQYTKNRLSPITTIRLEVFKTLLFRIAPSPNQKSTKPDTNNIFRANCTQYKATIQMPVITWKKDLNLNNQFRLFYEYKEIELVA